MSALQLLRGDPADACQTYGFKTSYNPSAFPTVRGGGCGLTCTQAGGKIYQLEVGAGTGDFFFPYVAEGAGGVGYCDILVGQRDGTLALTGGMNGCALQVNRTASGFRFYHDANGRCLAGTNPSGTVVCRVEYKDYAGALELGAKLAQTGTGGGAMVNFEHTLICVHHERKWKVFVSGILTRKAQAYRWYGASYIDTSYSTFTPTVSPLITSFDDE